MVHLEFGISENMIGTSYQIREDMESENGLTEIGPLESFLARPFSSPSNRAAPFTERVLESFPAGLLSFPSFEKDSR